MKNRFPFRLKIVCSLPARRRLVVRLACLILLAALTQGTSVHAQKKSATSRPRKLPSAEKIVGDYLKATGGKKRHAAIKDATYEWEIQSDGQSIGGERKFVKAPVSTRSERAMPESINAVSARSAWTRAQDKSVRTLTDAEADADRLAAALDASRLVDYKKLNVLARTVAFDETLAEPAFVVEFSTKKGARLRYWFGAKSKLLLKTENQASGKGSLFGDYRAEGGGVLEPHRKTLTPEGQATLVLRSVSYNTGLADALFDPPAAAEALDIPALLREVEANQEKIDERVSNYAFTEKRTEREINDKGEMKKEKITVHEIYPLPGGGTIYKLMSEDGVPLSAERAVKQDKKIAESVEKYEREREKKEQKKKEEESKGKVEKKDDDDDVGITVFLRACEFVSPRRERLRDREAVVFDFRPRPGFKPNGTAESIVSKLVGVVWIDPADKTVIRLEAKLAESYKIAGGLFASIRPGSAFVFEQTRMADGVWLPRFIQVNFAAKIFLFKGVEANETREFSDYRRFDTEASDYKLGTPAANTPAPPNP